MSLTLFRILSAIEIAESDLEISKAEVSETTVSTILSTMFGILGVIAMMVIVISGMMFVLSRGEPEKAAKARRGVIYASVGLILAILAVAIVRFATRWIA